MAWSRSLHDLWTTLTREHRRLRHALGKGLCRLSELHCGFGHCRAHLLLRLDTANRRRPRVRHPLIRQPAHKVAANCDGHVEDQRPAPLQLNCSGEAQAKRTASLIDLDRAEPLVSKDDVRRAE